MEFQVKQLPASADKTTNKTIFNMQTPMPFTDGFVYFSTSVYKITLIDDQSWVSTHVTWITPELQNVAW